MKKFPVFTVLLLVLSFFMIESCKDNNDPSEVIDFVLSPESIYLSDFDTVLLYLSTKPSATIDWKASTTENWIELQPSSGTIQNNIQEIKVISNVSGLVERDYYGQIEIISSGAGKGMSQVILSVGGNPIGKALPTLLEFGEETDTLEVIIENEGTGHLEWEMSGSESWLTFEPSSGITTAYEPQTVLAIVSRSNMEIGTYHAVASIQSNSIIPIEKIAVDLDVPETAIFSFDTDTLNFGYFKEELTLIVENTGNVSYDWNLSIDNDYIVSSVNSGSLNSGETAEIIFSVSRDGLESNQYFSDIQFTNNKGVEKQLASVVKKYEEEKWMLNGRVIDAEYDREHDVIIAVTDNPFQLLKLDPTTETIETIPLNLLPWSVSVLPDGTKAVVGHDAKVSYIDLLSMTIIEEFNIAERAFDIVLAPNNYAYVFPATGQWVNILCLDLMTGNTTPSEGYSIYDGTHAKLHPSGDYMYGANTGLSPSDFEKYDIRGGTASLMYDSPYHGDYSFMGNIWISDDGLRLFARSRNVFISTTNQNTDMTYNGNLSGEKYLVTLDHSSAANKIYTIETAGDVWITYPSNEVKIYDAEYLNYTGSTFLPGFFIPDDNDEFSVYESEGHFGFFNSSGNLFYVLVKARDGSGLINDWAVVTIDVE